MTGQFWVAKDNVRAYVTPGFLNKGLVFGFSVVILD